MQPELPKVELPKPPEFPKSSQNNENSVGQDQQNIEAGVQSVGSLGAEAGLNNFEHSQPQPVQSSQSDSTDGDDVDSTTTSPVDESLQNPLEEPQKIGASSSNPKVAQDKDDIEKVWIDKAKKIVQQTKGDPFMQERATSRLQADYMKKRFGKDVKLPAESK